jgi:anaerobic magnesium-protoporphyrin IX monomethyl ester cyclase
MPAWRIFLWVKLVEAVLQLRPKALWRSWLQPDSVARAGMRWYTRMGRRVWPHEWIQFFLRERRTDRGPTLEQYWGAAQDHLEIPLRIQVSPARALARARAHHVRFFAHRKSEGIEWSGDVR